MGNFQKLKVLKILTVGRWAIWNFLRPEVTIKYYLAVIFSIFLRGGGGGGEGLNYSSTFLKK